MRLCCAERQRHGDADRLTPSPWDFVVQNQTCVAQRKTKTRPKSKCSEKKERLHLQTDCHNDGGWAGRCIPLSLHISKALTNTLQYALLWPTTEPTGEIPEPKYSTWVIEQSGVKAYDDVVITLCKGGNHYAKGGVTCFNSYVLHMYFEEYTIYSYTPPILYMTSPGSHV